jgi:Xaa-Pro aminopeptidase
LVGAEDMAAILTRPEPRLPQEVYQYRRMRLSSEAPDSSLFLIPSAKVMVRNGSVHHPFRQESNFYYLTGWEEPESFLALTIHKQKARLALFVRPRDQDRELWEGRRYGVEGALQAFSADEVYPIEGLSHQLPSLMAQAGQIYYGLGQDSSNDQLVVEAMKSAKRLGGRKSSTLPSLSDPEALLGKLRLFKGPEEVALMRAAAHATAMGHRAAMAYAKAGMFEREIEGLLDFEFRRHGCGRLGYESIVAGGSGATCLHYRSNDRRLVDGELLLIDAGGEYGYYTADVTRTFPIGRQFSKPQSQWYKLVLSAQESAISMVKPGVTLQQIHREVIRILVEGLLSMGLLDRSSVSSVEKAIQIGAYKRLYPHQTSHWLGLDVHDAGSYSLQSGVERPLEPGMVFTIEPGLYGQLEDQLLPLEFRGMGIRIEDDVLVTETGCEVLTSEAPKSVEEITELRNKA